MTPSMFFEAATDEAECGWYLCRFWLPNLTCDANGADCGLLSTCRRPPSIRIEWNDEVGGESAACEEHATVARTEWQSMIARLSTWAPPVVDLAVLGKALKPDER